MCRCFAQWVLLIRRIRKLGERGVAQGPRGRDQCCAPETADGVLLSAGAEKICSIEVVARGGGMEVPGGSTFDMPSTGRGKLSKVKDAKTTQRHLRDMRVFTSRKSSCNHSR